MVVYSAIVNNRITSSIHFTWCLLPISPFQFQVSSVHCSSLSLTIFLTSYHPDSSAVPQVLHFVYQNQLSVAHFLPAAGSLVYSCMYLSFSAFCWIAWSLSCSTCCLSLSLAADYAVKAIESDYLLCIVQLLFFFSYSCIFLIYNMSKLFTFSLLVTTCAILHHFTGFLVFSCFFQCCYFFTELLSWGAFTNIIFETINRRQ